MVPRNGNSKAFNSITPFCKDKKSLYVKIAILSTQKVSFPDNLGFALLFLEYFQLMSQIFLLNSYFQPGLNSENVLSKTILLIAKVLTPSQLIIFEGIALNTCIVIMSVLTFVFLLRVALFVYIGVIAAQGSKGNSIFLKLWAFTVKTHTRVGYYIWTSFWTRMIFLFSENKVEGAQNSLWVIWCLIVIILEFSLAVIIQMVSSYFLPTKDFLAQKSNRTEITVLLQKVIMQILEFSPIPHTDTLLWIISIINILFCLVRDVLFFRTLPLYKIRALLYQLCLSITTTCLSIPYLVSTFLRSVGSDGMDITVSFVVVIWFILSFLTTRLGLSYLDSIIYNLVTKNNNKYSPNVLIHRIIFIKGLLKLKSETFQSGLNYRWSHLLNKCCTINISDTKHIRQKEHRIQLFTLYLEELSQKFPNNDLIKLYLAYYYGKKQKLYGLSMTVLVNLRYLSPSIATELNISLLIHQMQMALIAEQKTEGVPMDIYTYIQSLSAMDSLKESMLNQAQLQIDLCNEIIQNTPSLASILIYSQKISGQRSAVENRTKYILSQIPEYFIEPFKLIAHYQLLLNHSKELFEQYSKEYDMRYNKYEKFFSKHGLCQENLYEKNNLIIVTSGSKENLGKVVYRNAPTLEVYGREILGGEIFTIAHPGVRQFFRHAFQLALERGDDRIFRKILPDFQYNSKTGWAAPSEFYMDINPFLSQDLYFFVMLRLLKNYNEFIILLEDGTIDTCSKKIGLEVGCLPLPANAIKNITHIRFLSEELDQINHAFNMIAFPEKYKTTGIDEDNKEEQRKDASGELISNASRLRTSIRKNNGRFINNLVNLSTSQAQEIYSIYTTEGQTLRLNSIKQSGKSFLYNCKVQNLLFDSILLKILSFEKKTGTGDEVSETTDSDIALLKQSETKRLNSNRLTRLKSEDYDVDDKGEEDLSEDEKKSGWIDFGRLNSFKPLLESQPSADILNKDGKLSQNDQEPPSSTRNLLTTKSRFSTQFKHESKYRPAKTEEKLDILRAIEEPKKSQLSTRTVDLGKSGKVSKAFNEALKIKYYPKFYIIFLRSWYLFLTAIMANQIRLSVGSASDIESLQSNKNVLRISSARTDFLISVHLHMRSLWKLAEMNTSFDATNLLDYLDQEFTNLRGTNQELILNTGNVIGKNRMNWFQNDIKVYEDSLSQYTYRNNFQAIDAIIVAGFTSIAKARVNTYDSIPSAEFVLRNSLNDLLIKTNVISDRILSDIYEITQVNLNTLDINLWVTVSVIILMASYFIVMAYVQFKDETANLLAFTKLNNKAVENVVHQFIFFKKTIEEDLCFEETHPTNIQNYSMKNSNNIRFRSNTNQNGFQSQGYKGISRRFFLYGFQTYFLLSVITVIISVSHIEASNSLTNTQRRFSQLHFSDDMNQKVSLALTTLFEIMSNPNATNTTYIQNYLIMDDIQNQLQDISNQVTEIPLQFTQKDLSSDPIIEEILYEDSCRYIENGYFQSLCQSQQTGTTKNGIIQVLSNLEFYIRDILAQASFASFSAQLAAVNRDLASRAMFSTVSDVLNNHFDQIVRESTAASRWINAIIIISLLFVCVVVHVFVLRPLGESDNDFKKLLHFSSLYNNVQLPAEIIFIEDF